MSSLPSPPSSPPRAFNNIVSGYQNPTQVHRPPVSSHGVSSATHGSEIRLVPAPLSETQGVTTSQPLAQEAASSRSPVGSSRSTTSGMSLRPRPRRNEARLDPRTLLQPPSVRRRSTRSEASIIQSSASGLPLGRSRSRSMADNMTTDSTHQAVRTGQQLDPLEDRSNFVISRPRLIDPRTFTPVPEPGSLSLSIVSQSLGNERDSILSQWNEDRLSTENLHRYLISPEEHRRQIIEQDLEARNGPLESAFPRAGRFSLEWGTSGVVADEGFANATRDLVDWEYSPEARDEGQQGSDDEVPEKPE